jgi:DNA polymerase III subunit beta
MTQTLTAVTVLTSELVAAVNDAHKAINARSGAPILHWLRLGTVDGLLEVTGYDYELSVTRRVPVDAILPDVAVPGAMLMATLKKLDAKKPLQMTVEGDQFVITQGTRRVSIGTRDLSEYPEIPAPLLDRTFTITGERLKFIADKMTPFAGRDAMMPVLTAINFVVRDGILTVGSTDRFRAALFDLPVQTGDGDFDFLLTRFGTFGGMFRDEKVSVGASTEYVSFHSDATTVTIRSLEGSFPKLDRIFPAEARIKADFDPVVLLKALKFVECAVERNCAVEVEVDQAGLDQGLIRLSAGGDEFASMSDTVPADIYGDDAALGLATGFNPAFLADVVKVFGKARVTISANAGTKPSLFTSDELPDFRVLLMPRRLVA